jgi:outer membrane biosynthesis protein TonB
MKINRIVNAILISFLFILAAVVMVNAHSTYAANMKCPKNKVCFIAEHEVTHEKACRFNANKPWQWVLENGKKIKCGEDEKPKPSPTRRPPNPTPKPTDVPDPTEKPKPTDAPTEPADPVVTKEKGNPTPTVAVVQPTVIVEKCDWCDLFRRFVEAHERQADALEGIEKELAR